MSSEWMKVMLDEVARKKAERAAAQAEEERRNKEAIPNQSTTKNPGEQA